MGDVATSNAKEAVKLKITRLWHMRLAHVVEKSPHSIVKKGLLKGATPSNNRKKNEKKEVYAKKKKMPKKRECKS